MPRFLMLVDRRSQAWTNFRAHRFDELPPAVRSKLKKLGFEKDFDDLENDFDDLEIFDPTLFEAELNFRPTLNWAWADVADSDRQSAAAIRLVDVLWNTGLPHG